MGLLFLNSIIMISFFLVGNIKKKLMVLHKLSEMDILKKKPQIKRFSTLSLSCRQPMVRLSLEKL